MDLNLSPEEIKFRDELRAWLTANVPKDWDERREESMESRFEYLKHWQRKLYEGGWAGISWPKEYGGRGASLMEQVIFWQEMALAQAPPLANVLGLGIIGPTIIAFGTEAQKKRYLAKILSAEEIWCQGFSEPDAGSDLANVRCEAKLDGDHYIVNGQKVWNSYGWAAHWCELVVRTDPDVPKHKGLTVLLVDMKTPGVDVRPLRQMTGETEFNELFFHDVRVPVANVVGKVNEGWGVAMGTLMHERGTFGAGLQITYQRNMERLIDLARTTGAQWPSRGGRSRSSGKSWRNAMPRSKSCAATRCALSAASTPPACPGPEGSIQKIFWSELNQRFQQIAQELLGPYGQLEAGDRRTPSTTACGLTAICGRAATRLKRVRQRFSAISLGILCSGCRRAISK